PLAPARASVPVAPPPAGSRPPHPPAALPSPLPDVGAAIAPVAWSDMSSAFSLWSHRAVVEYLTLLPAGSFLADTLAPRLRRTARSEEHTSELQSREKRVWRLLLVKNTCRWAA